MHKNIDQENFRVLFDQGERLVKEGKLAEAIAAYRKASEMKPDNMRVHAKLANAMIKMTPKMTEEAITSYQKAISINPEQAPWWIYTGMGSALNQNQQIDEAIAAYQKAIKLKPDLPLRVYRDLAQALKHQGQDEAATTLFQSSQWGKTYSKIWEALNQTNLESFEEESSNYPTEISPGEVTPYFEQTSQYKVIKLKSLGKENQSFLESVGLSLNYLKSNGAGLITQKGVFQEVEPTQFQSSMIEEGYIYALCPSTGQILRSDCSFSIPQADFICYRFVGQEVFYLITGRPATSYGKVCLYFPKTELIIDYKIAHCDIQAFLYRFKSYLVTHWEKVRLYLTKNEKAKTVAVVGHNNLGHYIVNVLSGLEKQFDQLGNLSKVDKFLIHGAEYFGSTDNIFPEIPLDKIERTTLTELSQDILEKNYFIFRLGNDCVSENLADRIYQTALNQCSPSLVAQVEEAKKCFPLVSISFRLYKRAWVSQIEGIASIISKLSADFPNLGVIFDGFSLGSSNADTGEIYSSFVKEQIKKENALVKQILGILSDQNIPIYNTVGCRMHESIVWANAVDFYIASMGANLTKSCTLARKPGVGFSNTDYMQRFKTWYGSANRENAIDVTLIPAHHIIDIGDGQDINNNYDCDWKVIYDEVMKLIPKLNQR